MCVFVLFPPLVCDLTSCYEQLVNASRRCVFAAAALLDSTGDVLMYRDQSYLDKMRRDISAVLDIEITRAELKEKRRSHLAK